MYSLPFVTTLLTTSPDQCTLLNPKWPGGSALLIFTGTRPPADLIVDDLVIRRTPWPSVNGGSLVHRGFARRTARLLQEKREAIREHSSFIVAGHSLGGACATLAASRILAMDGKHIAAVYTFGAPRLATLDFVHLYNHQQDLGCVTRNFATPRDPVVHRKPNVFEEVAPYIHVPCDADEAWDHHDMNAYRRVWG